MQVKLRCQRPSQDPPELESAEEAMESEEELWGKE